jgi:hypothetical protein
MAKKQKEKNEEERSHTISFKGAPPMTGRPLVGPAS